MKGQPTVPIKMLRYQQQFSFFDPDKLDDTIRFINLSHEVLEQNLDAVLERIVRGVEETSPCVVVVDSFRTVARAARAVPRGELELQSFLQRLAIHLTGWRATTFLVGEYTDIETRDNPVFTVADGVLRLSQSVDRNSVVRKLQVVKSRGQSPMPGLHTIRITQDGLRVFPRIVAPIEESARAAPRGRVSTGVADLDEMLGGGIPAGDSVLVAGPSGSGKSVLASQFIAAGVERDEPGVLIVFEEHPKEYLHRANKLGFDLEDMVQRGKLVVLYLRPLDLSPDETLHEIRFLDNISNGSYTQNLDPTILVTDDGRAFAREVAGPLGMMMTAGYARILEETGVRGHPFVRARVGGVIGSDETQVRRRVDDEMLFAMNAYISQLPAPRGARVDPAMSARGREVFRRNCTACHNVDQSKPVPALIVSLEQLWPDYRPIVLMPRVKTLSPVQNSPGIYDDKLIIADASKRGDPKGIPMPLLLDLARKRMFLHDASVHGMESLFDPLRGAREPHPFYIVDPNSRADLIAFLRGLDTGAR